MDDDLKTKLRSPTGRNGQVWALCEQAANEIERLEKYEKLVVWAMRESWQGCDIDGGELQDKALKLGVIKEVPGGFDPKKHEDWMDYLEPGDTMYELEKAR